MPTAVVRISSAAAELQKLRHGTWQQLFQGGMFLEKKGQPADRILP
jgi:hypothetical protein